MFADEDIKPLNFRVKSHVATTFLCMHFCSNYIGWSNQGKYYEIETHYANRMWQHDFWMKQIFFISIFLSENTGRLAEQAGYPGHNFWHTL
jgi:hypothetical protein